jgi:ParB family chromosome partitioning protein
MTHLIKDVPLHAIRANPYRELATFPWIEAKVDQLMRSIQEVGFWESIIARPTLSQFEAAFGHHRIEAATRLKLKTIPLIVRPLSDRDMIRFMGRENGEDYNSDFLVMLNTWEGAVRFVSPTTGRGNLKAIEIATLLGWIHPHTGSHSKGMQMSKTAAACAAAFDLVQGGHISRDDLRGLTTSDAREVVVATHKDIGDLHRAAQGNKRFTAKDVAQAQNIVARSAKATAEDVRAGRILKKDIRTEVRLNVLRDTRRNKPKLLPLFADFSRAVIAKIDNMLHDDRAALHISQIEQALPNITLEEDHAMIRDLHHSLGQLTKRAEQAIRRTTPGKIVKLKAIQGEG